MKQLLLPAALLSLLAGPGPTQEEEIAYGLEEDVTLLRTFEARGEYELAGASITIDGDEREAADEELIEFTRESLERVVVRDEVLEVEDGRPTDFERTFVELLQESSYTIQDEDGESTSGSDLEGRTIRFLWDEDDEAWYAESIEDDEGGEGIDEDVLEWLTGDMDLAQFLPDGEVEVDDSWDIDAAAYLPLMWPSGLVGWYDEGTDGESEEAAERNHQVVENLEGSGTATLAEIRDEDDVRVAVIEVELDIETYATGERTIEDSDGVEVEIATRIEYERTLEGTLLWNLDQGHLHSAEFETDSSFNTIDSWEVDDPEGNSHEIAQSEVHEGTITYTVSVERE